MVRPPLATVLLLVLLVACSPVDAASSYRVRLTNLPKGAEVDPPARVWRWQNPLPQGNPLRAVAFADGQAGWAVGDLGTILATTDGGATWAVQRSGTTANLWGIAAPSASAAWAVGAGGTILRTTDGGTTWRSQTSGTTNDLVAVAAGSTSVAWAVGDAIYGTDDGGTSWRKQATTTGVSFKSVTALSDRVAWATDSASGVSRTVDGQRWTRTNVGAAEPYDLDMVAAASDAVAWAAGIYYDTIRGTFMAVFRTTDGGATWTKLDAPCYLDTGGLAHAPDGALWVACSNRVRRSTDDGATWSSPFTNYNVDRRLLGIAAPRAASAVVVGEGGAIERTTDAGNTWTQPSTGFQMFYVGDAAAPSSLVAWVVGYGSVAQWTGDQTITPTQRSVILKTDDGGASWQQQYPKSQADANEEFLAAVSAASGDVAWAAGVDNDGSTATPVVLRTVDGGATWSRVPTAGLGSPLKVAALSATSAWILQDGRVSRTDDAGATWTTQFTPPPFPFANSQVCCLKGIVAPTARAAWVVDQYARIFHTADGGATWSQQSAGSLDSGLTAVAAASEDVAWAVGTDHTTPAGQGIILHTADGGATWSQQLAWTSPRQMGSVGSLLTSISAASTTNAWAVDDSGSILSTRDGGAIWSAATTVTTTPLTVVRAPTYEHVWAFGNFGATLRGSPE